jgi:hypothetical protein
MWVKYVRLKVTPPYNDEQFRITEYEQTQMIFKIEKPGFIKYLLMHFNVQRWLGEKYMR